MKAILPSLLLIFPWTAFAGLLDDTSPAINLTLTPLPSTYVAHNSSQSKGFVIYHKPSARSNTYDAPGPGYRIFHQRADDLKASY